MALGESKCCASAFLSGQWRWSEKELQHGWIDLKGGFNAQSERGPYCGLVYHMRWSGCLASKLLTRKFGYRPQSSRCRRVGVTV